MSDYCNICTVFNAQETWLQASVLMQGYNCTVFHAFKAGILIPGYCQTVGNLPCTKDGSTPGLMPGKCQTVIQSSMRQRPGFRPGFWCQVAVRLLYDLPCTKDLVLRQGFDVRLLSDSCTIFHDPKTWLHARFWCRVTDRQLYNLLCTRDLASFQGLNALATVSYVYDLLCTKYLALSQHFNVVCCWCCFVAWRPW